jgi:hypothetical protein
VAWQKTFFDLTAAQAMSRIDGTITHAISAPATSLTGSLLEFG